MIRRKLLLTPIMLAVLLFKFNEVIGIARSNIVYTQALRGIGTQAIPLAPVELTTPNSRSPSDMDAALTGLCSLVDLSETARTKRSLRLLLAAGGHPVQAEVMLN